MSVLRLIAVERLTREAFEPFGDVIDTHGPAPLLINQGRTERFHQLAGAECLGEGARAILSIFVNCDEVLLNTPIQPVLPEEGS